jgi:excisionase family DNA binding protein
MSVDEESLLTITKAAERAGVSRLTIRGWIVQGYLRATKVDNLLRIAPADLIATQQQQHAGDVLPRWRADPAHAGRRLRHYREAAGLDQPHLAQRVGISPEALSNLERGHRAPLIRTVHRLAAALGIPPADLVRDAPVPGLTTMSVSEVATELGVPPERVQSWLRDGILPGQKVSHAWHIPRVAVLELERSGHLRGTSRRLAPRYRG